MTYQSLKIFTASWRAWPCCGVYRFLRDNSIKALAFVWLRVWTALRTFWDWFPVLAFTCAGVKRKFVLRSSVPKFPSPLCSPAQPFSLRILTKSWNPSLTRSVSLVMKFSYGTRNPFWNTQAFLARFRTWGASVIIHTYIIFEYSIIYLKWMAWNENFSLPIKIWGNS